MTAWPPTRMSSGETGAPRSAMARLPRRLAPVLLLEPLDAARRVDQLLLAGEEWVAGRADLQANVRLGRSGLELVATRAAHDHAVVLRVDCFLHNDPKRS